MVLLANAVVSELVASGAGWLPKLQPRDALGVLRKPDPARAGILIYGADAERVAIRRRTF